MPRRIKNKVPTAPKNFTRPPSKDPDRVKRRLTDEAAIALRRKRILELTLEGYTTREIADMLEVGKTTVWEELQTELLDLRRTTVGLAEAVRDIEVEQWAKIIANLLPTCVRRQVPDPSDPDKMMWVEPNLGSIGTLVRVTERRAKLLGLDAPKINVDITIPWAEFSDDQMNRIGAGADIRAIIRELEQDKANRAAEKASRGMKNITPKEAEVGFDPDTALVPRQRS